MTATRECTIWVVLAYAICAWGEIDVVSIPGDISWREAAHPPLNPQRAFCTIDYGLVEGGIAALDTTEVIAVPELGEVGIGDSLDAADRQALAAFSRRVARDSVWARRAAVVAGDTVIRSGDLLLVAGQDLPASPVEVESLRLAGVDSLRVMVNLAHTVLAPQDLKVRKLLLYSPTIFERTLSSGEEQILLDNLIDADPATAFTRLDAPARKVEKRAVVLILDLERRFPVGLIRFYPRPEEGLRISAYSLETNDGISVATGVAAQIAGAVGVNPLYELLQIDQNNLADTVSIRLSPPEYLQRFKFRSLTTLDYDIAELEVYNHGFFPRAVYLSRPIPFQREGVEPLLAYMEGSDDARGVLSGLQGSTLGRVFWEEEKLGNPSASRAVVSLQTGWVPETERYLRLNINGDAVEWHPHAAVVDPRPGQPTTGSIVDLDDPLLRAAAQEIWKALGDEQRAKAQTTFYEYVHEVNPAAKTDRSGNELGTLPNSAFWSGFQPVGNGQLVAVPGGRPFFQLRVEILSRDPAATTGISNLRIEQDFKMAALEVTGEVAPIIEVKAGEDTTFTYAIRPRMDSRSRGFNRLLVHTPARVRQIEGVDFIRGTGGAAVRESVPMSEWAREDSFFVVGFPAVTESLATEPMVVIVRFKGRVLDLNTTFRGEVFMDDGEPAVTRAYTAAGVLIMRGTAEGGIDTLRILPQSVVGGNAMDFSPELSDGNTLRVVTSLGASVEDVVTRLRLTPSTVTPNGDGINDLLTVSYDILRVLSPIPVTVEVFDLSGRRLWWRDAQHAVGEHSETWDGRNAGGSPVPPGLYVVRVRAATNVGGFTRTKVLGVAY